MIGVFDSGFGGLSVFREIEKALPEHDLLYLGDTQRQPYGNRSKETIIAWTKEAVEYLFANGCQLIIIACHTASSQALRTLQQQYLPFSDYRERRILGVTIPLVEEVCALSKKRVGVLGTRGTCKSGSFSIEIKDRRPELEVFEYAAPLLVPLVEEGFQHTPECRRILKKYLIPLKQKQVDTIVLGCTHFPLLLDLFREKASSRVKVPDPSQIVADKLLDYLERHPEIDSRVSKHGNRTFLTTDCKDAFSGLGKRFLGRKFETKRVSINF